MREQSADRTVSFAMEHRFFSSQNFLQTIRMKTPPQNEDIEMFIQQVGDKMPITAGNAKLLLIKIDNCDLIPFVCTAQQCLAKLNTHMSKDHPLHDNVQKPIAMVAHALAVQHADPQRKRKSIEMTDGRSDNNPGRKKIRKK